MRFVWVPEAPTHPGLYANKSDLGTGKVVGLHKEPSTMLIQCAHQFDTCEECQDWCDTHPHPKFIPVEHSFDQ